ncbi:hypothetical protein K492DRAFT_63012 [Lichtheimia hyalospora FSU 10163]|nr:hypothetical protein K492DRAFT_63012 [Lichtheimia hyalospora FSU 10163]
MNTSFTSCHSSFRLHAWREYRNLNQRYMRKLHIRTVILLHIETWMDVLVFISSLTKYMLSLWR